LLRLENRETRFAFPGHLKRGTRNGLSRGYVREQTSAENQTEMAAQSHGAQLKLSISAMSAQPNLKMTLVEKRRAAGTPRVRGGEPRGTIPAAQYDSTPDALAILRCRCT
jgi:hypothetical protein